MAKKSIDGKPALTRAQRVVIKKMKDNEDSFIVSHLKMTGTKCYRLLSNNRSPIINIRTGVINRLINRNYLKSDGGVIVLN